MKKFFTFIIVLSTVSIVFAQKSDKALARVRYSFRHITDTTRKDKPYTENMLLVIGKNTSVYTSYDKINRDLQAQKRIAEQLKNQGGVGNTPLNVGFPGSKPVSPMDYYFFASENKFFTKEHLFNNYLIEEDAPKINWKITKDTASFSGVKCKKAITYFKGRNWIAWFAPELPFSSGPWKLNGLPGLIIDAYDEKKEVQFKFAGIENVSSEDKKGITSGMSKIAGSDRILSSIAGLDGDSYLDAEIKLPEDAIKTTQKELNNLRAAYIKDPLAFKNAQLAAIGSNERVDAVKRPRTKSAAEDIAKLKMVMNNPIELPEKK